MPDFKKSLNLFFLLFLLLAVLSLSLNLVDAIQIQLSKESYNAGETLIAKVDADFINPPSSDNIFFYRGHVLVNMIYDAVFSNNTLFIYAIVPDNARNYTIAIKNIKYKENSIIKETGISKNFSVSSEKADFYITPGFILTDGNFNIRAVNKKDNYTNIRTSFQSIQQNLSLPPLGYKLISLSAKGTGSFSIIYLSLQGEKTSYSVPVLIFPAAQTTTTISANETNASTTNISQETNLSASSITNEENASPTALSQDTNASNINVSTQNSQTYQAQEALRFNPDSITELSMIQEQLPLILTITLMNLHTETIADISFSYDKKLESIISIAPDFIDTIEPASSQDIELTLKKIEKKGFFNGNIYAKSDNFSAVFYLEVNITKDYSNLDSLEIPTEKCNVEEENICQSNEFCVNATQRYTAEGICCPKEGFCKKLEQEKTESSSGKIIGFAILLLVIIIALLLFMKFKKAKKKDIAEIYEKVEEKYAKEPRA